MKVANWVEAADSGFGWVAGDRTLAQVYEVDGLWHAAWFGESGHSRRALRAEFECADDACLAAEKIWPPTDEYFDGWLESRNGGYFRKFAKGRTVYVRQSVDGWYAVQTDGKLLGKGVSTAWFPTAIDAFRAVEKERYTPVDRDPFVDARDRWRWIDVGNTTRAA